MKLRFGDVTFDGGRRLLLRGPDPVHLSPKAFQLLELLLAKRPNAVGKSEIQEVLWPRTFVSDTNLPALVNELRNALGDQARDAGVIRTVHAFGYAFEADVREVHEAEPEAGRKPWRHVLLWGAREIGLAEGEHVLGREGVADVWIGHPSVSREHARIRVAGDTAVLRDLGSKNGTFVGSHRVEDPTPLRHGALIKLGSVVLSFHDLSAGRTTRTVHEG